MSNSEWEPVTDPDEIKKYNSSKSNDDEWEPVTDQKIIEQYNQDNPNQKKSGLPFAKLRPFIDAVNKKPSEAIPERLASLGRGFLDIGQGAKQLYLKHYGTPEEAKKYTQQVENERNFFNKTPAGRDVLGQDIRNLPAMAALGPLGMEGGIFSRMAASGLASGTERGLEFTPENESRRLNMLKAGATGAVLPLVPGALKAIPAIGKFGINAIKDIPNIFREPFKNISPLEQKAAESGKTATSSVENYNEAKENYGTPASNEKEVFKTQERLKSLQDQLAEKPHVIPVNPEESKANLLKSQMVHQEAKKVAEKIDENISTHLNEGTNHEVRTADKVFDIANAERRALGNGFKELEEDFDKREIPVNNEAEIKQKTSEIHDLIKSGHSRSPEMDKVLKDLDALNSEKPKSAKEYLNILQSVRGYARDAREKAYSYGINKEERLAQEAKFNELDEKADEMSKTLESSVGEEDSARLKALNQGWRKRVIPLQRNRLYQRIRHEGRMSSDIIKSLSGSRNKGNQIIKGIIQNDPELIRNVVGQRYVGATNKINKIHKIHKADETAREYIDKIPELRTMIEQRKAAQSAIPIAEEKAKEAEIIHKEVEAAHTKNFQENEKRSSIQNEIKDIQENKLPALDRTISDLRKKKSVKNLALKEKIEHENDFKKAKEKKEKYSKRLATLGGLATKGLIGYTALKTGTALLNRTPIEENTGEK